MSYFARVRKLQDYVILHRLSRMLSSLCLRSPGAWHASQRAELLRYLLDHSHCMQLTSLNVRLETPVHCALRSCSFEVLEVSQFPIVMQH